MRFELGGIGLKLLSILLWLAFGPSIAAQKKWDGGGGDGKWTTALNWFDDMVPAQTDSVLLDNEFVLIAYSVQLPDSETVINKLRIAPMNTQSITLVLPATNVIIPGLRVNAGMYINPGAVFINASGASPGTALVVADSIYILNGGRLIHRSSNGHASYISRLSVRDGTESGTVEFDVPGSASYTISLSGRTYGNLEINSSAAGGTKNYLSSGTNAATIRGTLRISNGVNYAMDFGAIISIRGALHNDGNFNIASATNNNVVRLGGDLNCAGTITETAAGLPILEFVGGAVQEVAIPGSIQNSVGLRVNNNSGIRLSQPLLLSFKLELTNGRIITTAVSKLILNGNCILIADSLSNLSFVEGPMSWLGLTSATSRLCPVGKDLTQRWIQLKEATGDFTIEFKKADPHLLSSIMEPGLDHISSIEYWQIESGTTATSSVQLSFDNVNSGGVTDLAALRVSQRSVDSWKDEGNIATSGTAGSSGSVTGKVTSWTSSIHYFTLGSINAGQNPLPVSTIRLTASRRSDQVALNWVIRCLDVERLKIEESNDGHLFRTVKELATRRDHLASGISIITDARFFRIKALHKHGPGCFSNTVSVEPISVEKVVVRNGTLYLSLWSRKPGNIAIRIVNYAGQIVAGRTVEIYPGLQMVSFPIHRLATGYYHVFGLSSGLLTDPLSFFKL
ncbi:MAG: hypothetical protein H7Y31_09945 [Chitinophagaceae bacterium]|nr:hypothetical protein [Chitinophagaceae bacterium]